MGRSLASCSSALDVHKDSIDIALAEETGEVRLHGRIGGDMQAINRAVRKLESSGKSLLFPLRGRALPLWHPAAVAELAFDLAEQQ